MGVDGIGKKNDKFWLNVSLFKKKVFHIKENVYLCIV